ncbi:fumarylacetoacetate hydrolase family protein [Roseateles sp. DC23W]|uniref:Fumarylacetoacetate hydrolase family protein n=1 Tax=Pelomonas dachongensis TaxID=3299029 RepID=A0ABW7ESL1_9BURK
MQNNNASLPRGLPDDATHAVLVGRVWCADVDGPVVVAVRGGELVDLSGHVATMAELLDRSDRVALTRQAPARGIGAVHDVLAGALAASPDPAVPRLLAPCDLQAIKACGVTFAVSLLERVIEAQAGGDAARAHALRESLRASLGADLASIRPGSATAQQLKAEFVARGAWSPYLEVGLGPDAEVFTKAQPMSAVGFGAAVGLHPDSQWNNPEPEVVLAVNARGEVVGATLGNDVNLRDIEGRSALLLGKAKDNNGSCAIGPFIRLFDDGFTLDTVRAAAVSLRIEGAEDGFVLDGVSRMQEISRDPLDLVRHAWGAHHQYPDGFMLFLGTMFSPIQDRGAPGAGFTHRLADVVTIASPALGCLINTVQRSDAIPPWTYGTGALLRHLRGRPLPD